MGFPSCRACLPPTPVVRSRIGLCRRHSWRSGAKDWSWRKFPLDDLSKLIIMFNNKNGERFCIVGFELLLRTAFRR